MPVSAAGTAIPGSIGEIRCLYVAMISLWIFFLLRVRLKPDECIGLLIEQTEKLNTDYQITKAWPAFFVQSNRRKPLEWPEFPGGWISIGIKLKILSLGRNDSRHICPITWVYVVIALWLKKTPSWDIFFQLLSILLGRWWVKYRLTRKNRIRICG